MCSALVASERSKPGRRGRKSKEVGAGTRRSLIELRYLMYGAVSRSREGSTQ